MVRVKRTPKRVLNPPYPYLQGAFIGETHPLFTKETVGRDAFRNLVVKAMEANTGVSWESMTSKQALRVARVSKSSGRINRRMYRKLCGQWRDDAISMDLFQATCLLNRPKQIEWAQKDTNQVLKNL